VRKHAAKLGVSVSSLVQVALAAQLGLPQPEMRREEEEK